MIKYIVYLLVNREPNHVEIWAAAAIAILAAVVALKIALHERKHRKRPDVFCAEQLARMAVEYTLGNSDYRQDRWQLRLARMRWAAGKFIAAAVSMAAAAYALHGYIMLSNLEDGNQRYFIGDPVGALVFYSKALRVAPQYEHAHLMRGECLIAIGKLNAACDELRTAGARGTNAEAFAVLGETFMRLQKPNAAMTAFEKAIALNPLSVPYMLAYADCLKECGYRHLAYLRYLSAINLDSKDSEPRMKLGEFLIQEGSLEEGLANCRKAVKLAPESALAHYHLGNAYAFARAYDMAEAEYRIALDRAPGLIEAHVSRAIALKQLGSVQKAKQELQICMGLVPASREDMRAMAVARKLLASTGTVSGS
jgi:tetratricopeptide (TPR) repeat protein